MRRLPLLGALAVAALLAGACVEDNGSSSTECEDYGHLEATCLGCAGSDDLYCEDNEIQSCEDALDNGIEEMDCVLSQCLDLDCEAFLTCEDDCYGS